MGEFYRAYQAIHQLRSIFDPMSSDVEYVDNLCCGGDMFDDKEEPQWQDRYDHISTHYKKMIDTIGDHLKDMDEFYELKWRLETNSIDVLKRKKTA